MSKRVNNAKGRPSKNKSTGFQYRFLKAERAALIKDAQAGGQLSGAIKAVSTMMQQVLPKRFKNARKGSR